MDGIIRNKEQLFKELGIRKEKEDAIENTRSIVEDSGLDTIASYLDRFRPGENDGRIEFHKLKKMVEEETSERISNDPLIILGAKSLKEYMAAVESNMKRVVMVVPESSILEAKGSSKVLIWSEPLYLRKVSENYDICKESLYAEQLSAFSFGTGFFIKKNVIATAAHVVVGNGIDIDKIRFVYGYQIVKEDDFSRHIIVPKSNVFRVSRVAGNLPPGQFEYFVDGSDWALMEVTNAYEGFKSPDITPVERITARTVKPEDQVYSIGHGLGLPLKISFDGRVKNNIQQNYFETSLTLLGGNSGSPVFFADTHELAGIYIRGVKKLVLNASGKCLIVRNSDPSNSAAGSAYEEGQECQDLEPVYKALSKNF